MAFKKINLDLDTLKKNIIPYDGINAGDSVQLDIAVKENGKIKDLTGQTLTLYVKRSDGTVVEQKDEITISNATRGEITIKAKNTAFNTRGSALLQLKIKDVEGIETTAIAYVKIGTGLLDYEAVMNTNEVEALEQIEAYLEKARPALEKFISDESEFNKQEQQRQTNEVKREAKFIEVVASATESKTNLEGVIATAEEKTQELKTTTNNANDVKTALQSQNEKGQVIKQYFESNLDDATNVSNSLKTNVALGNDANALLKANIKLGRGVNNDLESILPIATEKDKELKESIKNANDFINALEPDKDIPGLKLEINAIKEGLQQNQELSYKGASVKTDGTLEGRTKDMTILGKTTYKRADGSYTDTWEESVTLESFGETEDNKISILSYPNYIKLEQGSLLPTGEETTGNSIRSDFIKVYKDTKYKITNSLSYQSNIYLYDSHKKLIKFLGNVKEFTATNETEFIRFRSSINNENDLKVLYKIESKNLPLAHLDYANKKDILLKEPLRGIKKIKDEIFEEDSKVKIKRKIGERSYQAGDEKIEGVMTDKQNTYYVLNSPIIEIVEGIADIDLDTYQTTTHFNIENAVKGELEFKVPSNLGSIIQNNAIEINNIWDTINDLIIPTLFELKKNSAELLLKNNLK